MSARTLETLAAAVLLGSAAASCQLFRASPRDEAARVPALAYPRAARVEQADTYHGEVVRDPYRWLEDPDSPETRAWIEAENRLARSFLDAVSARGRIAARLEALWDYERFGVPRVEGGRLFFTKQDGLQDQAVLYVLDSPGGEPRVLLDPNGLSPDGTVALSGHEPSPGGALLAYGLAGAGSDWQEWRVRDVATGRDLEDRLLWIKFSGAAWTRDAKGFFYARYDEPKGPRLLRDVNYHQKLYYHRLGTSQSEDELVYQRPDEKEWAFDATVTDDGRYLVIAVRKGTDPRRRIYWKDLAAGGPVTPLIDSFEAAYELVGNDGPVLWLLTDLKAPRGRLVALDTRTAPSSLKDVIPEGADALLEVSVVGDVFIAQHLRDARSVVRLHRLDGSLLRELPLPGLGTATGFHGKRTDAETYYSFAGFTAPAAVHRLDVRTGESGVFRAPELRFRPEDYATEQVFVASKDGTRLPMFITRRVDAPAGPRPALLHGYGGFNIPITPGFSVMALAWMEMGGLYAVANLRGGGEYGEEWHQAGSKLRKQNVFDDFIAAAEWLVARGRTTPPLLAIHGRSNGGLLVGACMNQRPDLFGAALPAVGVLDMLRFHKFTIGWAWTSDYGSPEDPAEYVALRAYSPLHNLREGVAYPATLITTADHDDRVVPGHSFKFAAALQAAQGGPAPVLIRIDTRAGHGAGKPTSKQIDEAADQLAFLVKVLGVEVGG
ncbi:MAG: S9 family peptidase [Planctomycetes bacterium]|nr:S9 family peptidase [Planctomycetota bacterium]